MTNQKTILLGIVLFQPRARSDCRRFGLRQLYPFPQSESLLLSLTSICSSSSSGSSRHCHHVCSCVSRPAAPYPPPVPADSSPACLNHLKSYRSCFKHGFQSKGNDFRGDFQSAGRSIASDFVSRLGRKQSNGDRYFGHEDNWRADRKDNFFRSM